MDKKVTIREATSNDAGFLSEILVAAAAASGVNIPFNELHAYPDAYQYISGYPERSDVGVIAQTIEGKSIGAAWVRLLPTDEHAVGIPTPELTMGVIQEYRRKGIGQLLMTALYRAAMEKGIQVISLGVHKDNISAIMLYKKQQWSEVGTFKDYIMMSRKIDL